MWQARYRRETDYIMALLDASPSGTVFYDISLPQRAPWYTFGMPVGHMWRSPWHYALLWSYYITPSIAVVPENLRYALPSPELPRYSDIKADTSPRKVPEFSEDGRLMMPFITARGDTLVYFVP